MTAEGMGKAKYSSTQSLPETVPTEYYVPEHVGETVVLQPGQHAVKAKRKYTKRVKTVGVVATPTFVDRDAIRKARIQVFIEYVDGNRSFESAAGKDQGLRSLDELAAQLLIDQKDKK